MNRILKFIAERSSGFLYILVIFISILGMSIETGTGSRGITESLMGITGFFQTIGSNTTIFFRESIDSIRELGLLREEYEKLQQELVTYRDRTLSFDELQRENEQLRNLLNFDSEENDLLIPARIIAKTPGSLSQEFVINKGSDDGVTLGNPIVTFGDGERILVGKVELVSGRNSVIVPIFSSNLFVAARLSVNRYEGLVSGMGELTSGLLMNYVDRAARNTTGLGEKIITSGLNSIYPPGLSIGVVSAISAEPWETGLQLQIRPDVDFSRIEYVYVLSQEPLE